jgi:spermidine/putrescine transport system permease protein
MASAVIVFATSVDDFVISSFLSSGASSETVPVRIYSAVRASSSPALNALATTMVALSFLALGVALLALTAWRRRHGEQAGLRSALGDVTQMEL